MLNQSAHDLKGSRALLNHLRLLAGLVFLVEGVILALPLVPGPGIPLILLGLMFLSDHFAWAKRTLEWARRKWDRGLGK
jgi:hypothetical protein